jgi:rhodanese-related sulfurtransferase
VKLPELSGEQLRQRLAAGWRPWLVHVGTADEFAAAHLPGAVWFPHLEHLIPLLQDGDPVVLYGAGAAHGRGSDLSSVLTSHASDHLWHYAEGLAEWQAAGHPLEP